MQLLGPLEKVVYHWDNNRGFEVKLRTSEKEDSMKSSLVKHPSIADSSINKMTAQKNSIAPRRDNITYPAVWLLRLCRSFLRALAFRPLEVCYYIFICKRSLSGSLFGWLGPDSNALAFHWWNYCLLCFCGNCCVMIIISSHSNLFADFVRIQTTFYMVGANDRRYGKEFVSREKSFSSFQQTKKWTRVHYWHFTGPCWKRWNVGRKIGRKNSFISQATTRLTLQVPNFQKRRIFQE